MFDFGATSHFIASLLTLGALSKLFKSSGYTPKELWHFVSVVYIFIIMVIPIGHVFLIVFVHTRHELEAWVQDMKSDMRTSPKSFFATAIFINLAIGAVLGSLGLTNARLRMLSAVHFLLEVVAHITLGICTESLDFVAIVSITATLIPEVIGMIGAHRKLQGRIVVASQKSGPSFVSPSPPSSPPSSDPNPGDSSAPPAEADQPPIAHPPAPGPADQVGSQSSERGDSSASHSNNELDAQIAEAIAILEPYSYLEGYRIVWDQCSCDRLIECLEQHGWTVTATHYGDARPPEVCVAVTLQRSKETMAMADVHQSAETPTSEESFTQGSSSEKSSLEQSFTEGSSIEQSSIEQSSTHESHKRVTSAMLRYPAHMQHMSKKERRRQKLPFDQLCSHCGFMWRNDSVTIRQCEDYRFKCKHNNRPCADRILCTTSYV